VGRVEEARHIGSALRDTVARYDWSVVGPQTDYWLEGVADGRSVGGP
jgi:hypothetical protein